MTHPDTGAPSVNATTREAGEWILARVLGDAIAAANAAAGPDAPGILCALADETGELEFFVNTDEAGRAAASALRFFTTTADLFEDHVDEGIPLFALVVSLPPEIPSVGNPAPSADGAEPDGDTPPPPSGSAAPSRLDLMHDIRHALVEAFPTGPRRRAFVQGFARPRGARRLRDLTTAQLAELLGQVHTVSDAFRRRSAPAQGCPQCGYQGGE